MRSFDVIAKNSERLFDEALQCLLERRFATATALAIFSFEEAAKYVIYKREAKFPDLPKGHVFRHEVKHEEIGEFFWLWAIYSVLSKTFKEFKSFAYSLPDADQQAVNLIGSLSGGDAVDYLRYKMFKDEDEMREFVKQNFEHPELLEVSGAGRTGDIEKIRRRALYVDLSPNRDAILTSPDSITEIETNEWLKIAWFGQEYIKLAQKIWN